MSIGRQVLGQNFLSLYRGITSEDAKQASQFAQVLQRICNGGILGMADQIDIEQIFPRLAAKRPRFNFCEVQIAESKAGHCLEERTRSIRRSENERSLPLVTSDGQFRGFPLQKKKAGKVL